MPLGCAPPQNFHKCDSWTLLLTFGSAWNVCRVGVFSLLADVTVQPEGRPSLREQRPGWTHRLGSRSCVGIPIPVA